MFADVSLALQSSSQAPLGFLGLAALLIHAPIGFGLVIGPYELRKADEFSRAVFAEPRLGAGLVGEIGRLLDFPDVGALSSGRHLFHQRLPSIAERSWRCWA